MLDPRLYRAALVPILFVLIVCAFSLENRPDPLQAALPPDAFDGATAFTTLQELGDRYPDRRPGSAGDEALATEIAQRFRAISGPPRADGVSNVYDVRAERFEADTADGRRELVNVIARRAGAPGPGILIVAHRDALGRGARAELSGTAGLLELGRVLARSQVRRTITFVSTSGGSGGAAGAQRVADRIDASPVDAVIVLGDLAGERVRRPFVVPWGNDRTQAPFRLTRTVDAAVRLEAATDPGGARASAQLSRLALPGTVGEQGPFVERGVPAVLLSVSGERPPRPAERVLPARLESFGRAALRSVTALDGEVRLVAEPTADIVTLKKVLPSWAVRLLVLALLAPALLVAVDGLARANRRGEPVGAALSWLVRVALPVLVALAFSRALHLVGLLPQAPPVPLPGVAVDVGAREIAALVAAGLAGVLAVLLTRPHTRFAGPGAGIALALALGGLAFVVWLRSPHAALLLVLPVHMALLLTAAPAFGLPRAAALGAVALAFLPAGLVAVVRLGQLGVDPGEVPGFLLAIVAGGHVHGLAWPVWALLCASVIAAFALAWRTPRREPRMQPTATIRGPLGYAGPGSLGGTPSGMRR